jgi:hypothetical protein
MSSVCVCVFVEVGFLWKEEEGGMEGMEGVEGMEKKVNRTDKWLYVQTYIVPTQQNDKKPIGNGKNPACNILAGEGLGLWWGQRLWYLR